MKHTLAVLGDLHYEVAQEARFVVAQQHLREHRPDAVVQLGDHGGYSHCGSWRSFMEGRDFLAGIDAPFHTLIGNHDMEGAEYHSDAESIAAWCAAFGQQRPYCAFDLGPALGICLSAQRYRSNVHFHHEVHLEEAQIEWFRSVLAENRHRPTFVFSHAPIWGSGLRVLLSVHLKLGNSYLNHADRPERFLRILDENPQIKLWFSAHNHLGHSYPDSVTHRGQCAFVHTGVVGDVTRDGHRQSRWIDYDDAGYVLGTVDHNSGERCENFAFDYRSAKGEHLSPCTDGDGPEHFAPPACPTGRDRCEIGGSVFAVCRGMVVEFDAASGHPVGVVAEGIGEAELRRDRDELQIVAAGHVVRTARSGRSGRFSPVFEPARHEQPKSA
jgi:3',5'-cyclic AMP phosphodiesterase CpdA